MRRPILNILLALVWTAGNLTPLLLLWLLWPRLHPAKTPLLSLPSALQPDLLISLIFPLQHSIWTQRPIRRRLLAAFGEHLERPAYVLTSGIALVLTVLLWRCSDLALWSIPAWTLWPLRAIFAAMIGIQIYSTTQVGAKFLTGIAHLKSLQTGKPLRPPEFKERGLYRWIRHPIAASQIVMLWCAPVMFADRLLLASLWTLWIVAATALEDRRLGLEFGEIYASYRRRAGFLWPRLGAMSGVNRRKAAGQDRNRARPEVVR